MHVELVIEWDRVWGMRYAGGLGEMIEMMVVVLVLKLGWFEKSDLGLGLGRPQLSRGLHGYFKCM